MGKLKKPTIEGFIERLLEEENINTNEARDVQDLLEQSSKGMEKEDISKLVTTLSDKLDASSNELITPNGLNLAGMDSVVKEITQTIKKEQIQKEERQSKANVVDPLQENKGIDNNQQEKQELESYIDDVKKAFSGIPELANYKLSQEDYENFAKSMKDVERIIENVEEIVNQNPDMSFEEALEKVTQKNGINTNSGAFKVATGVMVSKKVEQMQKEEGISADEAIVKLAKSPTFFSKVCLGNEYIKAAKSSNGFSFAEFIKQTITSGIETYFGEIAQEDKKTIESNEGYIRAEIYNKNGTNVRSLMRYIDNLENAQQSAKKNKDKREKTNPSDEREKSVVFTKIMTKYLLSKSNPTISQLYEQYKEYPIIKKYEIEFEDFLVGIEQTLRSHSKIVGDNQYIDEIIRAERTLRKSELLEKSLNAARNSGNKVLEEDALNSFNKDVNKAKESIKECKSKYANRFFKNIEKSRNDVDTVIGKIEITPIQLETDIVRISKDRKQIIKISEELGISTDEAAEKYFSEHNESLALYTKKEKRILFGSNKEINQKAGKTLKKLGSFMKTKNDTLIDIYTRRVEEITQNISQGNYSPQKFESEWKKLEKAKANLERAQSRVPKIERMQKVNSTMGVFEKRERKEFERSIFSSYLNSGKSAFEFLEDFKNSGNESFLNKTELLNIIANGSRKYMIPNELGDFIANEKTIFYDVNLLEKLKIKKESAEKQGLTAWVESCDKKIKKIEENLEECKRRTAQTRETVLRRIDPQVRGTRETVDEQVNSQSHVDINQNEMNTNPLNENFNEGQTKENISTPTQGIEVATIKTDEGIKPNITVIAKKNKVTHSRIKDTFSKIMRLRKSKETTHDEHEIQEENNVDTQTEVPKNINADDAR